MKINRTENVITLLVSIGGIGLTIAGYVSGWEFWVPPILIVGMILLWFMNIAKRPDFEIRKVCYLIYVMFALFFYGVHKSSFFDVAILTVSVLVAFSFFRQVYMMNLVLAEYVVIVGIQSLLVSAQ